MHGFCLSCGAEFAYDQQGVCPRCGASQAQSFDEAPIRALRHPVPDSAAFAAHVLGVRRVIAAIPALIESSRSDEPEGAEAALEALAHFDDDRSRARILEALWDDRVRMRHLALTLSERMPL